MSTVQEAISVGIETFDVVLCDYDLDDGKGSKVVEHIRGSGSMVPIIAVSSHTEGNESMLEAGANVALSKLEFKKINEVISSLVSKE